MEKAALRITWSKNHISCGRTTSAAQSKQSVQPNVNTDDTVVCWRCRRSLIPLPGSSYCVSEEEKVNTLRNPADAQRNKHELVLRLAGCVVRLQQQQPSWSVRNTSSQLMAAYAVRLHCVFHKTLAEDSVWAEGGGWTSTWKNTVMPQSSQKRIRPLCLTTTQTRLPSPPLQILASPPFNTVNNGQRRNIT